MKFPARLFAFACAGLVPLVSPAANPIVLNQGLNDPHIHIFGEKAYVFASHDKSAENTQFVMDDWWIWSSPDLVHWKQECVIKPETTYIGKPFSSCWATDAAFRNGKYYFYFSESNQQTGVMVGDSPAGPWRDPLGKPLLGSELTPTQEYDPCVFQEADGTGYIIFGVWDYYIAKLNADMISLAEAPRKLELDKKEGPVGNGKTDDKPNVHKVNGRYYLSWGCYYAMADNIYGPYVYKGTVMNKQTSFVPGYDTPTWPNGPLQGRHGNFFSWHNQTYFTYCDMSQTGNRYFRDAFISYVHYKANGEMAPIRVDGIGVGEYQAEAGDIQAEDYFQADGVTKEECSEGGFMVTAHGSGGSLVYPNIHGLAACTGIGLRVAAEEGTDGAIEVRENSPKGRLLAEYAVQSTGGANKFESASCPFTEKPQGETLCLVLRGTAESAIHLNAFSLEK